VELYINIFFTLKAYSILQIELNNKKDKLSIYSDKNLPNYQQLIYVIILWCLNKLIYSTRLLNSVIFIETLTILVIVSIIDSKLIRHVFLLASVAAIGAAIGISLINNIVRDSGIEIYFKYLIIISL